MLQLEKDWLYKPQSQNKAPENEETYLLANFISLQTRERTQNFRNELKIFICAKRFKIGLISLNEYITCTVERTAVVGGNFTRNDFTLQVFTFHLITFSLHLNDFTFQVTFSFNESDSTGNTVIH